MYLQLWTNVITTGISDTVRIQMRNFTLVFCCWRISFGSKWSFMVTCNRFNSTVFCSAMKIAKVYCWYKRCEKQISSVLHGCYTLCENIVNMMTSLAHKLCNIKYSIVKFPASKLSNDSDCSQFDTLIIKYTFPNTFLFETSIIRVQWRIHPGGRALKELVWT